MASLCFRDLIFLKAYTRAAMRTKTEITASVMRTVGWWNEMAVLASAPEFAFWFTFTTSVDSELSPSAEG